MKKLVLLLLFFLMWLSPFVCFAQTVDSVCDAEIKDIQGTPDGEILVISEYTVKGTAEPFLDEKFYYPDRMKDLTLQQKLELFDTDNKNRCQEIIYQKYIKISDVPTIEVRKKYFDAVFDELSLVKAQIVGRKITQAVAELRVDTDNDKMLDEKWSMKSDGTKIIEEITPVPVGK